MATKILFRLFERYWKKLIRKINEITCEWFDHEWENRDNWQGVEKFCTRCHQKIQIEQKKPVEVAQSFWSKFKRKIVKEKK